MGKRHAFLIVAVLASAMSGIGSTPAKAAVSCVVQGTMTTRTGSYTLTASTSACLETPGTTAGVSAGGTLAGNCLNLSSMSGSANVGTTSGFITFQGVATILVIGAWGGRYVGVANAVPANAANCISGIAASYLVTGVIGAAF